MIKKTYKIEDMDCADCSIMIDGDLEDLRGVKSSKTSYAKGLVEVEFDPKLLTDQRIIATIKKTGYSVSLDTK